MVSMPSYTCYNNKQWLSNAGEQHRTRSQHSKIYLDYGSFNYIFKILSTLLSRKHWPIVCTVVIFVGSSPCAYSFDSCIQISGLRR
jgi:hypothetical protein